MNVKLLAVALGSLAFGALVALLVLPRAGGVPPQSGGEIATTGKALVGGPFTLTDHNGRRVTDADFRGRFLLVFFGFRNCPDICPSGLTIISAALDKLGPAADKIAPVLVTLDPERDSPEKLKEYLTSFSPRLTALTGTAAEIKAMTSAYRVYVKKVPDDRDPSNYSLDHSSILYLMGPDGAYRAIFPDLSKPDVLAEQLRKATAS